MPATLPSQRTWTLRFKNHRSTILLHVDPLQKLSHIRAELLKAITETHPDGMLNNVPIPEDPDDIRLARPVDNNDLDLGWEAIDRSSDLTDDEVSGTTIKGKGKATLTNIQKFKKGDILDSPQGVGLHNGGVLAFKFRTPVDAIEIAEGAADEDRAILAGVYEKWDVKVPTLEETYGDGHPEAGALPNGNEPT